MHELHKEQFDIVLSWLENIRNKAVYAFTVSGHPLDENSDYDKPQTNVYIMSSATVIIGGYSYLTHSEMNDGWVYTIDGQTLEQHTGISYSAWLEQWKDKYKYK